MIPIDCDQCATMHGAALRIEVSDSPDSCESDASCVEVAIRPRFDSQVVDVALRATELDLQVLIGAVNTHLHDVDGGDDVSRAGDSENF